MSRQAASLTKRSQKGRHVSKARNVAGVIARQGVKRHTWRDRFLRVLDNRDATRTRYCATPLRSISVTARENNADHSGAVDLSRRDE